MNALPSNRAVASSEGGPCRAKAAGDGGSLGQITGCLSNVVGKFRPMV